jgi:group I intron endonuclease
MSYFVYSIMNKVSGKRYIGSTSNYQSRINDHKSSLKRSYHHSYRLQEDWTSEEDFIFEIIEENVPSELRYGREQFWMDYYQSFLPEKGYNISPTAGNCNGRRHREEAKEMMSKSHSGKILSGQQKENISKALKGRVKSEEHQRKITEALGKRDLAIYARGENGPGAKLKESDVYLILELLDAGKTLKEIASNFDVSMSTIGAIKSGRTWSHITAKQNDAEASA